MPDPVSLWGQLKAAVIEVIRGLSLAEVGVNVLDHLWPDLQDSTVLPCVCVTVEGEAETHEAGTTLYERGTFPVRVFFLDRDTPDRHTRQDRYMLWREQVSGAFDARHRELRGYVPGLIRCLVEPRVAFDPGAAQYRMVVGSLRLLFLCKTGERE